MSKTIQITSVRTHDLRYELKQGQGSDAVHTNPVYAYAVCKLKTDTSLEGVGLAFTLGSGNRLVCDAITHLAKYVEGHEIDQLMSNFAKVYRQMVDDPALRWLGPHKGVVHLAVAAVVNACYDLWAKSKEVPLWKLLIDLPPESLLDTLDFSYCEEVLTRKEALTLLRREEKGRKDREKVLETGYPGYDTSVGWFNYSDEKVADNVKRAMDNGFTAMKLKVGSQDTAHDIRRATLVRKIAGDKATIMFDANQQWSLPKAIETCQALEPLNPYWIEEPTHPDDIMAHVSLAKRTSVKIALGEHVPNKIIFKNYLQAGCMSFNQADAVRVGGVSEFILISLLSRKFNVPMVPHVGDMGQIHQHLVLFGHISIGHPKLFLEQIPHLKSYFKFPVQIKDGHYQVPQESGMSGDLLVY